MMRALQRVLRTALFRSLILALAPALIGVGPARANAGDTVELADLPGRYRTILDLFSTGEQDRAVGDLIELETRLVEEPGGVSIKALWRSKLRVIRELLGAGNGILVPIALFHEQAYLEYLRRDQSALATHSRIMAVELIEVYAADSEQSPDLVLASNILTSLAGHLQRYYRDSDATALYYQAIRYQPTNVTAHLGVAAIHERHGDYKLAIRHLERLISIDPECDEGRLRLGVNLARAGRLDESAATLRPLLSVERPSWVVSVAYEEAARVEVERGDLEAAHAMLVEAVERFPHDTTLPIQLAYVADRAGAHDDPNLAKALRQGSDQSSSSPRYVYSQAPVDDLEVLRIELKGETAPHLATLADALGFSRALGAGS